MKANIYKELSNKNEVIEIGAGQTVAQALDGLDLDNAIVMVNGHKVGPDYFIRLGDVVTVRVLPSGITTAVIIGVTAIAVVAGVAFGVTMYQQQQRLNKQLEEMKKITNRPDIDNRPFIRGAENTVSRGNSQPYIMGRNFFTPYLLQPPFYTLEGIDGAEQYAWRSLEAGFNKQNIVKLGAGNVIIKTFEGNEPQQGSFSLDAGQIFAEGCGEISQDGTLLQELTPLNYKHVAKLINREIPRNTDVNKGDKPYFTELLDPASSSVDLAISFYGGLYGTNDSGDFVETTATITPQYSLDGGTTWIDFNFNNNGTLTNIFTRNELKELRYIAHRDFTLTDYETLKNNNQNQIIVRITNESPKSNRVKNDVFCLYTQVTCFDPNTSSAPAGILDDSGVAGLVPCLCVEDRERAFCTIIGLKIKATKNNENITDKINIITNGLARTWTGTEWTTAKTPTSNPAAWVLEVMTSSTHPASRIDEAEIDLQSLGEVYEHCEANGFYYDQVITNNTKKADTLRNLLQACGAVMYRDIYNRYAFAIDQPQENALAVFNAQNIINISNKKDFTRKADGVRIKYVNSTNDLFIEDTYLLMRTDAAGVPLPLTADSIIRDISLVGVTHFEHVVKYARRLMAIEELRPKITTIEVGSEGMLFTPMSKVLIQDESLKVGLGNGVISKVYYNAAGELERIKADVRLNFEAGKTYGLVVNCFDDSTIAPLYIKVTGTGFTNDLFIQTPIKDTDPFIPTEGDVFSFGELDAGSFVKITTPYIINNIRQTGTRFALELVNYNEAIYDSGVIPPYSSNITETPDPVPALPPAQIAGPAGKDGPAGLTITMEKHALQFSADADGIIKAENLTNKIQIYQQGEALPFFIGDIESPAGFAITSLGDTVYIKALAGAAMAKSGVIRVPINYRPILNRYTYVDGADLNYCDELDNVYGSFTYSDKVEVYDLYISYAKSMQGEQGGGYQGQELPAVPHKGDTRLDPTRCVLMEWNGRQWVDLPISDSRYYQAMSDIIATIDKAGEGQMQIVTAWVKNLVAGTILAEQIFTQKLELKAADPADPAYIKAYTVQEDGTKSIGSYIDSNGKSEFNDTTVRGRIYAEEGEFNGEITASQIYFTVIKGDIRLGRIIHERYYNHFEKRLTITNTEFESIATGTMNGKFKIKPDFIAGGVTYSVSLVQVKVNGEIKYIYQNGSVLIDTEIEEKELWAGPLNFEVGDTFDLAIIQKTPPFNNQISTRYSVELTLYTDRINPALAAMSKFIDTIVVY